MKIIFLNIPLFKSVPWEEHLHGRKDICIYNPNIPLSEYPEEFHKTLCEKNNLKDPPSLYAGFPDASMLAFDNTGPSNHTEFRHFYVLFRADLVLTDLEQMSCDVGAVAMQAYLWDKRQIGIGRPTISSPYIMNRLWATMPPETLQEALHEGWVWPQLNSSNMTTSPITTT